MPATNKTENFNLPLYVASDHFSVLGDFNSAMKEIDKGLGGATVTAKSASRDATSALTTANAASDDAHTRVRRPSRPCRYPSQAKADATRAFDMATKATTASRDGEHVRHRGEQGRFVGCRQGQGGSRPGRRRTGHG